MSSLTYISIVSQVSDRLGTDWMTGPNRNGRLDQAQRYLRLCASLLPDNHPRLKHLELLGNVIAPPEWSRSAAENILTFGGYGRLPEPLARAISDLDGAGIPIAFAVLSKPSDIYSIELRLFVSQWLKELFRRPENLCRRNSRSFSLLGSVIEALRDPVSLDADGFRSVVEHARRLSLQDGHDRMAHLDHLVRLRRKTSGPAMKHSAAFEDFVTGLAKRKRPELDELAFDLLQFHDRLERYRQIFIIQLADSAVAECREADAARRKAATSKKTSRKKRAAPQVTSADVLRGYLVLVDLLKQLVDSADSRQFAAEFIDRLEAISQAGLPSWCLETLRCLFDGETKRVASINVLDKVQEVCPKSEWLKTLFQACRSAEHCEIVQNYLFGKRWSAERRSAGNPVDMPTGLKVIHDQCRAVYDEHPFALLVADLFAEIEARSDRARLFDFDTQTALWLARLCPDNDVRRDLVPAWTKYHVIQRREPFYTWHVEICFGLLAITHETSRKVRAGRLVRQIERLFEEDSVQSPSGKSTHEGLVAHNLSVMRQLTAKLRELAG